MLVIGGESPERNGKAVPTVEIYNPQEDAWSPVPPMSAPRDGTQID